MSKRKFDFILVENRIYRDILRIYPNNTYIHSFDDNLPETWDDVYKVYYSFAIIRQYFDDNNKNIVDYSDILLDMHVDECSIIPNLSQFILYVIDTGETYDYPTLGQPAAEWKIEKKTYTIQEVSLNEEIFEFRENYNFSVFNNWTNQGYRFSFDKDTTLLFCDWLNKVNEYLFEKRRFSIKRQFSI